MFLVGKPKFDSKNVELTGVLDGLLFIFFQKIYSLHF